jgi:hypothetical protein
MMVGAGWLIIMAITLLEDLVMDLRKKDNNLTKMEL